MTDPRAGGNYTQPWPVHGDEPGREHIAYAGHVEIGRYETEQEAAQAVREAVADAPLPVSPSVRAEASVG